MWTVHTAHKVLSGNQLQLEIWLGRLLTKIYTEDLAVKLKGEILSLHSPQFHPTQLTNDHGTIGSKIRVEKGSNSIDVSTFYIFEHLISIYVTVVLSSLSIYMSPTFVWTFGQWQSTASSSHSWSCTQYLVEDDNIASEKRQGSSNDVKLCASYIST